MLKSMCLDWSNPGAIEQPVDLIAVALGYSIFALHNRSAVWSRR